MLTDFERVQTMLLASMVGTLIADSGARKRKAQELGVEAIHQATNLLQLDLIQREELEEELEQAELERDSSIG
jgi:hypothetical protein